MKRYLVILAAIFMLLAVGCSDQNADKPDELPESGTVSDTASQDSGSDNVSVENNEQHKEDVTDTLWSDPGIMRDMSSYDIVMDMGLGWNLGNTLMHVVIEPGGVSTHETAWEVRLLQDRCLRIFDMGFRSVRIPVAWSNLMKEDYTISTLWMDRVEEVVNYALDSGLYVVLNLHWDGGWIANFSTDFDETMKNIPGYGSRFPSVLKTILII